MFFDRLRSVPPLRAALILVLGTAFLSVPFMPVWDAALDRVVLRPRPELEVLVLVGAMALLALLGRGVPPTLRWAAAAVLALAALVHLGAAATQAVFEREPALFWDLPELPHLLGRAAGGSGWLALAGIVLAGVALAAAIAMLLREMERALRGIGRPQAALAVASLSCVLAALPSGGGEAYVPARIATEVARQTDLAWRSIGLLRGGADPLQAATPSASDLGRLKHRDVYLVLVDSYGAAMLGDSRLASALAAFEKGAGEAGYYLASSRLAAPGTEAGARLAEASLASGLRLDRLRYRMLLASDRRSIADYLAAAGYRTIEIAPDLRRRGVEERSWGFERILAAVDLGYSGPRFGGAGIPDQWTLEQVLERIDAKPHPPAFVRIELVSARPQAAPVPPYVEEWSDLAHALSARAEEAAPADAAPRAVTYDLEALTGFLARLKGQPLVIVLGNRAPASAEGVPIHVLSRDEDLVLPFASLGYAAGAAPPAGGAVKGTESFLPDFLRLFASGTSVASLTASPL
jgi:hypothetical protein